VHRPACLDRGEAGPVSEVGEDGAPPQSHAPSAPEDRWILSRLEALIGDVRAALDGYDAQRATRGIEAFVDDLSNWYVRRNRRRS